MLEYESMRDRKHVIEFSQPAELRAFHMLHTNTLGQQIRPTSAFTIHLAGSGAARSTCAEAQGEIRLRPEGRQQRPEAVEVKV